jgi:hypothetical protein
LSVSGGKIPLNNSQLVIESPDSVKRVRPPIKISAETKNKDKYNQIVI